MASFQRIINIDIEGLTKTLSYPQLEITFNGEFNEDAEPNTFEVTCFNLSQDTLSAITVGKKITLNAGYENDVGAISAGYITRVETDTQDVDIPTIISFQDASDKWLNTSISRTFTGPVLASHIIRVVTQELGIELSNISLKNDINYQTGKTVRGTLSDVVRKLARETQTPVTITNGTISFVSDRRSTLTTYLISARTGLIDTVEQIEDKDSKSEYKLTMLINHNIRPGAVLELQTRELDGYFEVVKGQYNDDFTCKVEIKRIT